MATAAKINRLGATSQEHRSHDVRSRRQPDEGLADQASRRAGCASVV